MLKYIRNKAMMLKLTYPGLEFREEARRAAIVSMFFTIEDIKDGAIVDIGGDYSIDIGIVKGYSILDDAHNYPYVLYYMDEDIAMSYSIKDMIEAYEIHAPDDI